MTVDVTNALSYIDISYVMSSALYEYFLAYYNIVSFMTSLDLTSASAATAAMQALSLE